MRPTGTPSVRSRSHRDLTWADLLSSAAMSCNLFGDLAADLGLADRAVHTWWPDAPGTVCDVRFAHSPGRFDRGYLGSLRAFDVAFVLDLDDGTHGIVGLDTKYHERIKREIPKPSGLPRYLEVFERSGDFGPGAIDAVNGTDLARATPAVKTATLAPNLLRGNPRRSPGPNRNRRREPARRPAPGTGRSARGDRCALLGPGRHSRDHCPTDTAWNLGGATSPAVRGPHAPATKAHA